MRFVLITTFNLLICCLCYSQGKPQASSKTKKDPHLLNLPKDTVVFNAIYLDIGKVRQREILQNLASKKLIRLKDYPSAIRFVTMGENDTLYLPYKDLDRCMDKKFLQYMGQQKKIIITAVIVKEILKYKGKPFFLIEKVDFPDL